MTWRRLKVSPKMTSQSSGWTARVYSSVRSCRILRSSTSQKVRMRLGESRHQGGITAPGARRSAETLGCAARTADIAASSCHLLVLDGGADVVAEDVVERRPRPEPCLQLGGSAQIGRAHV